MRHSPSAASPTLNRLETEKANRLRQARLYAENDDFEAAQQMLEPLLHFRPEYPELAAELDAIRELRARYHAGATRKVPGRAGTQWEEEDRVDVEATQQRAADD